MMQNNHTPLTKPRRKFLKRLWSKLWLSNWTEDEQLRYLERLYYRRPKR